MTLAIKDQKTEILKCRVTEAQAELIRTTYRSMGFETLSQYLRALINKDIQDCFPLNRTVQVPCRLNPHKNNRQGTNYGAIARNRD